MFPLVFFIIRRYVPKEGSGAGNNWGVGYSQSDKHSDELLDIITREAEDCDNFEVLLSDFLFILQGFMLTHSIAGGTGSGMGSYLLEHLKDAFPHKFIQTYSVFPGMKESSDVVTQPYNSILALSRLTEFADCTVVLDNTSLNSIVAEQSNAGSFPISQINALVSNVLSVSTSTLSWLCKQRFCEHDVRIGGFAASSLSHYRVHAARRELAAGQHGAEDERVRRAATIAAE